MSWTTNDKGAIAELAIATAAVKLGVVVLRPFTEGHRYDLVFELGDAFHRVQCKWGAVQKDVIVAHIGTCRHTPRGYVKTTYSSAEVDLIAVYCHELDRCFVVPIAEVAGRTYLHLRVAPARNNQRALVKMANDYDLDRMLGQLGAIAQLGERRAGSAKVAGSSPASSTTEQAAHTRGLFAV